MYGSEEIASDLKVIRQAFVAEEAGVLTALDYDTSADLAVKLLEATADLDTIADGYADGKVSPAEFRSAVRRSIAGYDPILLLK